MFRTLLLTLVLASPATDGATLRFAAPTMTFAGDVCVVTVDGCDTAVVSSRLDLPVLVRYLPLRTPDDIAAVAAYPNDTSLLSLLSTDIIHDSPTALTPDSRIFTDDLLNALPGRSPVTVELVERDNRAFARLCFFPVTVDPAGRTSFHSAFTLLYDRVLVGQNDLRGEESIEPGRSCALIENLAAEISPMYLIVTGSPFAAEAARLAAYKTSIGLTAQVAIIDDITARYEGRDDAARLRNALKDFSASGGRYVLLVGDETVLPVRHAYPYAIDTLPDVHRLQICDLYFADLTGDWDVDGDSVYGEPYADRPDLIPELRVGRLPFWSASQLAAYTDKLITYETLDTLDRTWLGRAFFFSSDEMRDYRDGGQHRLISLAYPPSVTVDTVVGVETPSGDDPAPVNLSAADLIDRLSDGYGIVNILAHGRPDAFGVRTSAYNEWPKSYMIAEDPIDANARLDSLAPNDRVSFYYSLACDNGGFDQDAPPFVYTNPNLVASALAQPRSGAVGFIAYSRWGWVSMSHQLQKAFFDSLFAHPDNPAVDAMALSKLPFPYYRDLAYGQNFYGDPSLRVYTGVPQTLSVAIAPEIDGTMVLARVDGSPAPACTVVVSTDSGRVASAVTDENGRALIQYDFAYGRTYTIAARRSGCNIARIHYSPSLTTDTETDEESLPDRFALHQNYPNPFNPATTISFDLARRDYVRLEIFDIAGRSVRTLLTATLLPGNHEVAWDGRTSTGAPAASGVYFYRLSSREVVATRKMVLVQ